MKYITFMFDATQLKLIANLEEKIADLILENRKLNSKVVEQEERHALHLKTYHDGQDKHSKLVLKLQNKVRKSTTVIAVQRRTFEGENVREFHGFLDCQRKFSREIVVSAKVFSLESFRY